MSTNKTENYHLHAWEAGDDFLRSEFNENFAAIDEALGGLPINKKLRLLVGSYLGDFTGGRSIDLGFRPKVVLVFTHFSNNSTQNFIALYTDNVSHEYGAITDSGFTIKSILNLLPNGTGQYSGTIMNPYQYIALDWEE